MTSIKSSRPAAVRSSTPSTPRAQTPASRPLHRADSFQPASTRRLNLGQPTNPVTAAGTRPPGWVTVGQTPLSGADLTTTNGVPQPAKSGWYVVSCPVANVFNHTSVAYFDAATKQWSNSTAIQGGQSVPTTQADLTTNKDNRFFPLTMGPAATAAGVSTETFNAMMTDDLKQLATAYGKLNLPYNANAPQTPALDQNCNVYTSYVLQSLGGQKLSGWLLEFPGMSVPGRDDAGTYGTAGRMYLDTVSKGELTRDRYLLETVDLSLTQP